ncbi:MAG: putative glycoside hydrolase [Candidatus Parcubacteria bacterium]|nr:putative glycoside hydrolase [Candidatus Parcubacteria bacterium]
MKKLFLVLVNIVLVCVIVITVFYLFSRRTEIFAQSNLSFNSKVLNVNISDKIKEIKREKPAEREVKGLYLTSYSASVPERMDNFITQIKNSDLNAVVIDIKDYSGQIAYDSKITLVEELQTDRDLIKDLTGVIKKFHDNNIYVIARQTVFQDPELAHKKPEWAVKNSATGGIWLDNKGLAWMDATKKDVWKYNVDIAKEAISLGFDEVNFDYIRFPSDGPMKLMQFSDMNGRSKAEVMAEFFKYLYENLKAEPAFFSGDLFGFTTERTDDMNIGQQIEDAALYFDYVCPMVYPSHYPSGYLDLKNPAAHPYQVVKVALTKGEESLAAVTNVRAKIRPWLQSFDMGAVYTPIMIEDQIRAGKEAGSFGYLLWNARNVYNYLPSAK